MIIFVESNLEIMRKILYGLALLAAVACGADCDEFDGICRQCFPEGEPGAAVIVTRGGRTLFSACYGIADTGTFAPVTERTAFNIASISKQFTAAAVMQLAEAGLLSLDDPMQKYFPEYTDPLWGKVQIRHLLSHSSGIPDKRNYPREVKIKGDDNLAVEYMQTLSELNFEPGSRYQYINPTYVLLGKLVERVSGEPFEDYMREHVFGPAGMTRTQYFGPEKDIADMAHAYEKDAEGRWCELDYGEDTFFATRPDGGIYTGTADMAKWIPALLAGKVVSKESLEAMWTPQISISGDEWDPDGTGDGQWYGYGFIIGRHDGLERICHSGGNGAFRSFEAYYPQSGTLFVVLAARSDWDRDAITAAVEEIFLK